MMKTMKMLFPTLLIAMTLGLAACGDDDEFTQDDAQDAMDDAQDDMQDALD